MCSHTYNVDELAELKKWRNMDQFVKRKYTTQSWSKIPGNPRKMKNKEHLFVWKSYYQKDKKQSVLQLYQKLFFK